MDHRLSFLMCESLNFSTVIRPLYFIYSLFGADFAMHGWEELGIVMKNDDEEDPMALIFPKITKCRPTVHLDSKWFCQYNSSSFDRTVSVDELQQYSLPLFDFVPQDSGSISKVEELQVIVQEFSCEAR